jgi:hypothetical protein
MQKRTALVVSLLAGASLANAQSAPQEFKVAAEHMENKTVTGAPYSAKALTTFTQTLADGTKINHTIVALLARDSQGRTRREQSMNAVGPWATNTNEHMLFIRDPIAQKSYVIVPKDQTVVVASLSGDQEFTLELKSKMDAEKAKLIADLKRKQRSEGASIALAESTAQVDDLGEQLIDGVRAKGRRETNTIPVGGIGNDRPIQIVSEVWYSDELQTVVLSKRSDPRQGESEYRLTEISRVEPARSMFDVPAGYSVREVKHD